MLVKTLIALIPSLAALASAAPALGAFKHDADHNDTNVLTKGDGLPHMLFHDCSGDKYVTKTTAASPLVEDCRYIADVIIPDFDHTPICWSWHDTIPREILSHGTCAVNIASKLDKYPNGDLIEMCNKDIQDFIHYSIDNFRWTTPDGRLVVGAEGYAYCPSDFPGHSSPAIYGLYHT
ncbi:putative necrosis-inducing factor-domain-containing protein [Neurospora tetraspora]|uniref:Necrosis-inducing factor-domain-containing protein n=1 Tax=Neurospora tetraspora TaxID=94610 RepID=A0AAE0JGN0_9PEZI|nr:putative necrosis-inducing factor-domain-containing protein [Neurospora tetraspora]